MNDRTATGMRTREQWRVSELRYRRKTAMQQPLLQPPLIDDHQEVIKYLREVVEQDFEVIATVGNGNALVAAAETLAPDVIVCDIAMPGLNGIAATAEILRRNSAARIVFVTVHNDPELVKKGLATGALGYVLKLTAGDDLVRRSSRAAGRTTSLDQRGGCKRLIQVIDMTAVGCSSQRRVSEFNREFTNGMRRDRHCPA